MNPARPRVLVLGGTGMLGHVLWGECSRRFDAIATVRADAIPERAADVLDPERTLTGVRVEDEGSVAGRSTTPPRTWSSTASGWSSSGPRPPTPRRWCGPTRSSRTSCTPPAPSAARA